MILYFLAYENNISRNETAVIHYQPKRRMRRFGEHFFPSSTSFRAIFE